MDPSLLTVYKSPFPKKRIGCAYDGGYIICVLPDVTYDILLSGGVAGDISFEDDLCNQYKLNCIAFDGTPHCVIKDSENIKIVSKNIDDKNDESTTDLKDLIQQYNNIFLKMDIEGSELPWIRCLTDEQLNKFSQIVMEFHFPFSDEDRIVFEKINKNHVLIHFHGNNCPAGMNHFKGINIPNVFECTYIHKKYLVHDVELNDEPIPSSLDMPNCGGYDIHIDYPPFVTKKI